MVLDGSNEEVQIEEPEQVKNDTELSVENMNEEDQEINLENNNNDDVQDLNENNEEISLEVNNEIEATDGESGESVDGGIGGQEGKKGNKGKVIGDDEIFDPMVFLRDAINEFSPVQEENNLNEENLDENNSNENVEEENESPTEMSDGSDSIEIGLDDLMLENTDSFKDAKVQEQENKQLYGSIQLGKNQKTENMEDMENMVYVENINKMKDVEVMKDQKNMNNIMEIENPEQVQDTSNIQIMDNFDQIEDIQKMTNIPNIDNMMNMEQIKASFQNNQNINQNDEVSESSSFKYFVNGKEVPLTQEEAKEKQKDILKSVSNHVNNTIDSFFNFNPQVTVNNKIIPIKHSNFPISPESAVSSHLQNTTLNVDINIDNLKNLSSLPKNFTLSPEISNNLGIKRATSFRQRSTMIPLVKQRVVKRYQIIPSQYSNDNSFDSPSFKIDPIDLMIDVPHGTTHSTEISFSNQEGTGSFTSDPSGLLGQPSDLGFNKDDCVEKDNSYVCEYKHTKCEILKKNNKTGKHFTTYIPCSGLLSSLNVLQNSINNQLVNAVFKTNNSN